MAEAVRKNRDRFGLFPCLIRSGRRSRSIGKTWLISTLTRPKGLGLVVPPEDVTLEQTTTLTMDHDKWRYTTEAHEIDDERRPSSEVFVPFGRPSPSDNDTASWAEFDCLHSSVIAWTPSPHASCATPLSTKITSFCNLFDAPTPLSPRLLATNPRQAGL